MRRNPQFQVPTRISRRMDQLCLLPRCVSTTDSPEIAKGSVVPSFFFLLSPISRTPPPQNLLLLFFFLFLSFLPFLFFFFIFFSFSSFSFLFPFSTGLFDFFQVRGSFLSLYYSSYHVSHFPWFMCHMDTCSRWHSPHHMALIQCVLIPWCHVATPGHTIWHHLMCYLTPSASKKREIPTISEFNEIRLGN